MAGVTINTADGQWITALSVNIGTASAVPLVAGVSGQRVRIYKLMLSSAAAQTITFQDGSTALTGPFTMSSTTPLVLPMDGQSWFTSALGNALNITLSSAANISGAVWYTQNNL